MNAIFWRRRLLFTAFRMSADDTTCVSSARQTFLLFGTFYVNKIPLLCRFGHSAMLEKLGPAILAKALQGVVFLKDWSDNIFQAFLEPALFYKN